MTEYVCKEYDAPPRTCIIINQVNYQSAPTLLCGDQDGAAMKAVFKLAGCKVAEHHDVTADSIRDIMRGESEKEHDGGIVVVLLGHGDTGVFIGIDNEAVPINEIKRFFGPKKCPSLNGKPKIFIIDACRGSQKNIRIREQGKIIEAGWHEDESDPGRKCIPAFSMNAAFQQDETDGDNPEVTINATKEGYTALYDRNEGSLFTQVFANIMLRGLLLEWPFDQVIKRTSYNVKQYKTKYSLSTQEPIIDGFFTFPSICFKIKYPMKDLMMVSFHEALAEWMATRADTIKLIGNTAKMARSETGNKNAAESVQVDVSMSDTSAGPTVDLAKARKALDEQLRKDKSAITKMKKQAQEIVNRCDSISKISPWLSGEKLISTMLWNESCEDPHTLYNHADYIHDIADMDIGTGICEQSDDMPNAAMLKQCAEDLESKMRQFNNPFVFKC